MSIRRKSINDGTTISKKMKRTIEEGDSEVPRRGRGEQGLELGKDWRTKDSRPAILLSPGTIHDGRRRQNAATVGNKLTACRGQTKAPLLELQMQT